MIDCTLKKNAKTNKCKKAVGEALFTMIIPKADNSGNKIKPSNFNKYVNKINNRFGGSTTKPLTLGCFKHQKRDELRCETGFAIETFRDFEFTPKLDAIQRRKVLEQDFRFMNKLAKESANEFGQESVPIIFDNISDVKLNKGKFREKLTKSKLTGKKIKGDLWKKHI